MKNTRIKIGEVGVDSGQLMVCDPCYIDSEWKKSEYGDPVPERDFSYAGVCGVENTHLNYRLGHAGVAVKFSSGYGDGTYPVYATFNKEGRVAKVEIIMIDDEDRHPYDEEFEDS